MAALIDRASLIRDLRALGLRRGDIVAALLPAALACLRREPYYFVDREMPT